MNKHWYEQIMLNTAFLALFIQTKFIATVIFRVHVRGVSINVVSVTQVVDITLLAITIFSASVNIYNQNRN